MDFIQNSNPYAETQKNKTITYNQKGKKYLRQNRNQRPTTTKHATKGIRDVSLVTTSKCRSIREKIAYKFIIRVLGHQHCKDHKKVKPVKKKYSADLCEW